MDTTEFDRGFERYVASKLGEGAECFNFNYWGNSLANARLATEFLIPHYDLGVALASDGLWLGYIFHNQGFPVKCAKLSRKGRGASWSQIDDISQEEIEDKKILLFDIDVVTGRTIRRATREIAKFKPEHMDLLLVHRDTYVSKKNYERWRCKCDLEVITEDDKNVVVSTKTNVPQEIRKLITLKDFEDIERRV